MFTTEFNGETCEMKRTTLISASLLLAFAGCTCGQGWRPNILTRMNNRIHGASNVGEPCDAGCQGASGAGHVANGGCDTCGSVGGMNYGGYEQVGDSYEVQTELRTVSDQPPLMYSQAIQLDNRLRVALASRFDRSPRISESFSFRKK